MMIKRFLAATLAALMLASGVVAPAAAMDWLINSYRFGAATPTPTLTFIGCTASTTDASSHTFTSHSVGTAGANRDTIVGVYGTDDATAFSATALTVGGDAATAVVNPATISQAASGIFFLDNPAGTSENIVVTWSETIIGAVVCVWAAYDLTVETAKAAIGDSDASAGVLTLNMNTNADGIAVGICGGYDGNERNATWVGLTEQVEGSNTTGEFLNWSAAQLAPTSEVNPLAASCDWDTALDGSSGAAATWDNTPAPPVTPITITWTDEASDVTNLTTYSFASLAAGTASADRILVAGLACSSGTAGTPRTLTSSTIGGIAATEILDITVSSQRESVQLVAAAVPSGTTATVGATFSGQCGRAAVSLFAMTGASGVAAFDTASDSNTSASDPTTTIDIPANGGAIAMAIDNASSSTTWTGLTERSDVASETTNTFSSASDNFASAQTGLTVTANFATNGTSAMAVASWGP